MEDGTVPRAIRNTIECTLREPSIVKPRLRCFRGNCAAQISSLSYEWTLKSLTVCQSSDIATENVNF